MAYTNSSLVVYTKLSPNHSGQRTHSIDRITPHCVVGQLSAESICGCFISPDRQASCNYGIGSDGRVSLCVEEKNRSWCTSSRENDQRAITIECASDKTHPYAFKDVVYNRLVELCIDICKRNGKKMLLWLGDKEKTLNYIPKSDEMVLTVHRWYANKSCPGDWMYARMGDLASKVTAALNAGTDTTPSETDNSQDNTPVVDVNDPEKTIWNTLQAAIGNAYGTAGLMGNLYAESALKPGNLQNTGNKALGMTDEQFVAAVDSGEYSADTFIHDGYGMGLAQWTFYTRKQALLNFVKAAGKSIGDLETQLAFLLQEIKGYTSVWNTLTTATSVREASDVVLMKYERPADQSESVQERRAGYGQQYYDKYAAAAVAAWYRVRKSWEDAQSQKGAFHDLTLAKTCADSNPGYFVFDESGKAVYTSVSATSFPYKVRVAIDDLNIRRGPGTNYASCGHTGKGVFTIVEEADGKGATRWGLLTSYKSRRNGWISLDFAAKV